MRCLQSRIILFKHNLISAPYVEKYNSEFREELDSLPIMMTKMQKSVFITISGFFLVS